MNSFIITYDVLDDEAMNVQKPRNQVYVDLIEAIKRYAAWGRVTESCWIVVTDFSAVAVRDQLLSLMRSMDRLFVIQSAHVAAWNNVRCSSNWLKENV